MCRCQLLFDFSGVRHSCQDQLYRIIAFRDHWFLVRVFGVSVTFSAPSKLQSQKNVSKYLWFRSRVARFFVIQYTKTGTIYQITTTLPNKHMHMLHGSSIFQMALKYTNISISRTSKIYPNRDFWFEKKPSGNPVPEASFFKGG
jgi:hypothetical protein